jgi:DNA gyrase subunit A
MIALKRPDLTEVDPDVRAYIAALEAELARCARHGGMERTGELPEATEIAEPPTTVNLVTISRRGQAKRTPRHLYPRQRRGGMGIFDLETPEEDPPAFLVSADQAQALVLITDHARVFRLKVADIPVAPVHSRGTSLTSSLSLNPSETPAVVLPDEPAPYLALLTDRGHIRWLGGHLVGQRLNQGMILYDTDALGQPAAACWTCNEDELFIATRQGQAIRFAARLVPARGCLAIRLGRDDEAIAVTPIREESGVLLMAADGKGTIRLMAGFAANKSPGAGGKAAMKTDALVAAATVASTDDVFAISRLGKLIRFAADEIPPKVGVVQGVSCMALRADQVVVATPAQLTGWTPNGTCPSGSK